jgi:hypothetical protein
MSMKRSQRGAARVSVTWLVVFLVLFIVGCLFGYLGYEAETQAEARAVAAEAALVEANQRDAESQAAITRLSEAVGWSPEELATPRTDLTALQTEFDAFKATFPDMGPDVKRIDVALRNASEAYLQKQRELATLNDALAQSKSEKETLEASLRDALRTKDTEISNLQRQLTDERNTAEQRQNELENRVAGLNNQRNELDAQLREARNTIEASSRKFEEEKTAWETRARSMTKPLQFLKEPEAADGKVISVARDLSIGYLDLGANQRLPRGLRFRVVSGKIGEESKLKAWAEVTDVKPTMAQVRFFDVADRFDPVVEGDIVYNPLYDPRGERTAVLAGRFSGQFNETELKTLLANMGIRVQDRLDNDTDYLIVGSELYVDENGQPLENPLPPQELAVYKNAESQGTQIVSIKQLRDYFKF